MTHQRKTAAEDKGWRRRPTRTDKPTAADAPRRSGRGPQRLPGQTDIWQQLDEIAAEQHEGEETPPA